VRSEESSLLLHSVKRSLAKSQNNNSWFGCPTFLNFGRNYAEAIYNYFYMIYGAKLRRYLLCQAGSARLVRASFGIYDAPEPWGPWTTAYWSEQ
jgi:hypothetical protein